MSGCRHGGRDVYARPPVREYDQTKPVRGRIVWDGGMESRLTYARFVNGKERRPLLVELDGIRFVPEGGEGER